MAVAPVSSWQPDTARIARRNAAPWKSRVDLEERAGRRPGVREVGHGLALLATRARLGGVP